MYLLHAGHPAKFRGYKYEQDIQTLFPCCISSWVLQDLLMITGQNKRNKYGNRCRRVLMPYHMVPFITGDSERKMQLRSGMAGGTYGTGLGNRLHQLFGVWPNQIQTQAHFFSRRTRKTIIVLEKIIENTSTGEQGSHGCKWNSPEDLWINFWF